MQDDPYTEIPDWLKDLQGPPPEDVLGEPPPESDRPVLSETEEPAEPSELLEPPAEEEPSPARDSLLDSLREQAIVTEEEMERVERQRPRGGLAGTLMAFAPWQRFVLSLLFFLVVTLLGLMCLIMTGRIAPVF